MPVSALKIHVPSCYVQSRTVGNHELPKLSVTNLTPLATGPRIVGFDGTSASTDRTEQSRGGFPPWSLLHAPE